MQRIVSEMPRRPFAGRSLAYGTPDTILCIMPLRVARVLSWGA